MTTFSSVRASALVLGSALAATLVASAPAAAQPGPLNMGVGPTLPKSGRLTHDTAQERRVLEVIKAPDGFDLRVFAGPPVAMYPTVVAPSPDGSVYVGVDLNLAQGAVKGRGRVMRLVDDDDDGRADRYTTFVDVDSPRGIVADGKTVFVLHPPNLTAYRDTDGDGIADQSDDLVKGIGFGLDIRSSDHSTNNITLGPDGWLYIAVGDYGYLNATGKDGVVITRHGGNLARVRTDGTGLETYAVGTRNIYDVGIDPFGHVFTRDNTNDGGGWDTRFHYLAPGANMGYPSLFKNFSAEHMQSIADYGGGSGTAGLWIQDPGFPDRWNNTLYTGDWTVNKVLHNPPTRRGASFTVTQEDFMAVPRAIDIAMDDRSHLFVASLLGGVFNYAGDTVGAIVRVSYPGRTPSRALHPATATDARLLEALVSANAVHRLWAQQEIVRRGAKSATVAALGAIIGDRQRRPEARASALFTLKRLSGARANPAIQRAAADPATREVALAVLVDDLSQLQGVPVALYERALADSSLPVRLQGMRGLVRLRAVDRAAAMVPLLDSPDSAVAHIAVQSLAALGARDVAVHALLTGSPSTRTRARFVLEQMHDAATVDALLGQLPGATDMAVRHELLVTLARLDQIEGPWTGDWWGTHPPTAGPYFAPVAWAASPRIGTVLRDALLAANGDEFARLADDFARNGVLPTAARGLLVATTGTQRTAVIDALIGRSTIDAAAEATLVRLDAQGAPLHAAIAELLAGESVFGTGTLPLARAAALDPALDLGARGRVLAALAQQPGDAGRNAAAETFARLNPRVAAPNASGVPAAPSSTAAGADPLESAWRRFVGDRGRVQQLDYFAGLAAGGDAQLRTLAYAVLIQAVRNPRAPQAIRDRVAPVLDAAWAAPALSASLVDAITIMHLESQYAEQLRAYAARTGR